MVTNHSTDLIPHTRATAPSLNTHDALGQNTTALKRLYDRLSFSIWQPWIAWKLHQIQQAQKYSYKYVPFMLVYQNQRIKSLIFPKINQCKKGRSLKVTVILSCKTTNSYPASLELSILAQMRSVSMGSSLGLVELTWSMRESQGAPVSVARPSMARPACRAK